MSEAVEHELKTICVFCGANVGNRPGYAEMAVALGLELVARELDLVYGGGSVGLMGVVARTVRDHGGAQGRTVVGIIPEHLTTQELMGDPIGELIVVETMLERKAQMAARADAFVALPGGFGTLDELFEAITWGQIGLHNKPIGLLNVEGFFDALLAYIDHCVAEGFVRPQHKQLLLVDDDPARLLERLASHRPPPGLVPFEGLARA